jgi:hypothetical protein
MLSKNQIMYFLVTGNENHNALLNIIEYASDAINLMFGEHHLASTVIET